MDPTEVEESLFAASDAKVHGEMCRSLSTVYCKILSIFPSLEAVRPRSKSGIQALCSLHIALEKAKNVLQHCSESSKLYLAITAESVTMKFERARSALVDSLRRVDDIVPSSIGMQIAGIVRELEDIVFTLDPSEKEAGDELVALLQDGRKINGCDYSSELESFHDIADRLGIASSRAALMERRALKKLIEKARVDEDRRKESIVTYLLHLMRKYSKLFRNELAEDTDSQGSTPRSPIYAGPGEDESLELQKQFSKLSSFGSVTGCRRSGQMPVPPPEELRCPISLQLMYDPVIISSGQTYERIFIEKWFNEGHDTCPKTQQTLPDCSLTPNYCVKGLITSWCEQNGVSPPQGPPESPGSHCWPPKQRGFGSVKETKVVPLDETCRLKEPNAHKRTSDGEDSELDRVQRCTEFLSEFNEDDDLQRKCGVVERVRLFLKDDNEARNLLGARGFAEPLVRFLRSAVCSRNTKLVESGAMALFNLAVNNNRNKEKLLEIGIIELLEEMISRQEYKASATALFLNLSYLEKAKSVIGASRAVRFLVTLLQSNSETQCKLDALHTLCNLSCHPSTIHNLLSSGIISVLCSTLSDPHEPPWTERSIAVLVNLASSPHGKDKMASSPELITSLVTVMDSGEPIEQENAVCCLNTLCGGSEKCSQLVLQEGAIPVLVSLSVNGTARGREKAQKLLLMFREQRHREQVGPELVLPAPNSMYSYAESSSRRATVYESSTGLCKSASKRKMGKALSFFWKSKSYSVYHC